MNLIGLDTELVKRAKMRALEEGKTLKQLVVDALVAYLKQEKSK